MARKIPKSVGAYRIAEQIGEGGMAHIYRATDKSASLDVALKVLKPEGIEVVKRRLQSKAAWEGEIALSLDHPHVVHTYEHGAWKDTYYIAMEMLDSFTLKYLVEHKSPLVQARKYRMLYQVAQGLAHVHEKGFIHRDLTPRNVLIDRKGSPKIIDLGLAIPAKIAATCRDSRSGTPAYMAPEQVRTRAFDQRVDIYSFGITMYEVLTGRHPFAAKGREKKMAGHLNIEALPPSRRDPSIPQALDELILRAMAKDPKERFGTMKELVGRMRVLFPAKAVAEQQTAAGGHEGRRFVRVDDQCFVRLRLQGMWMFRREYRTVTRDISLDGICCINIPKPLNKGQRLDLELMLRGEKTPLLIMSEIAWARPNKDKTAFDVGIQFKHVLGSVREKIAKYIRARIARGG